MNVLFNGFAITPYYRDFLNRIQSQSGGRISVTNIRPSGDNPNIGAGVREDFSLIEFDDVQLQQISVPPIRWFGLSDFERAPQYETFYRLADRILELAPAIIVVNSVHHAAFTFDKSVKQAVAKVSAKVVLHSIPFRIPTYQEAIAELEFPELLPLKSLPRIARGYIKGLRLDELFLKTVRRRSLIRRVEFSRRVNSSPDAHAVYHEGGVDVYESYGCPRDCVRVVRNSPNTEKLLAAAERHPAVDDGMRLIHVGRLVEWKRVDMLIRAVSRLRSGDHPQLSLSVVGYGPQEERLKELTESLNLRDCVEFCGGVYEPDDLAAHFSRAAIYVLAGMGGLSINEAMCFSKPIVCSVCDGTEPNLVRDGQNGLYFEDGNEDSLVQTLDRILSDSNMRTSMGIESRRLIDEVINTQIHVDNYLQLFDDLTHEVTR